MKVSSKGHYGLLALAELADNYKVRRAVQVKEIANNQQIPLQYLGQIMVMLRRGHLVHAARAGSARRDGDLRRGAAMTLSTVAR